MRPRTSIDIDTYIEVKVSVYADYQPYEAETLETPAVEEAIENMSVHYGDYDINWTLTKEQLGALEGELWKELEEPGTSLGSHFPDLDEQLDKLSIRGESND
jgi:hypothetical protein